MRDTRPDYPPEYDDPEPDVDAMVAALKQAREVLDELRHMGGLGEVGTWVVSSIEAINALDLGDDS